MSEFTPEQILKMIEDNGGPGGLDLTGLDLRGITLDGIWAGRELGRRGLSSHDQPVWFSTRTMGINLKGAVLNSTNLQGARLSGADLEEASMAGADLQSARLASANLRGADLSHANLQEARLVDADLQGARLRGADLREAWLWNTNLQDADLSNCSFQEAVLKGARLQGAVFSGAEFRHTPFTAKCLGRGVGEEMRGDWKSAQDVYLALRDNFLSLRQYADARWASIRQRRMGRRAGRPWRPVQPQAKGGLGWLSRRAAEWGRGLRYPRATAFWLWDWVQDFFTEYLTNPWRVLLRLAPAVVLILALFYFTADSIGIRPALGDSADFVSYILFSARGLAALTVYETAFMETWAWAVPLVEGGASTLLFVLFLYTLGRRIANY